MMVMHTDRVAPEEQISHLPAAVPFMWESIGIDMKKDFSFIVGDCGEVRTAVDIDSVVLTFLAYIADIDGKGVEDISGMEDVEIITIGPINTEQAYMLGKALLMAAKLNGISE